MKDKYKLIDEFDIFSNFLYKTPFLGLRHKTGLKIFDYINNLDLITIDNENWFRARTIRDGKIFSSKDLLPPNCKEIEIHEQRYNHYGQSYVYLAEDEKVAAAEILCYSTGIVWIQKFTVIKINRIADLSLGLDEYIKDDPFVMALQHAITYKASIWSSYRKYEYLITRFISDICKLKNYNGIIYNSTYGIGRNMVLFNDNKKFYKLNEEPNLYKYEEDLYLPSLYKLTPGTIVD